MAQTRRARRRKHRGTQAGTVEARGRTGRRPPSPDPKQRARQRRADRFEQPPTWRGALTKAAIAAALFGVLVIVVFGRPFVAGLTLAVVMVLVYLPMTYLTDLFIYRRRQRSRGRAAGGGQ